jgi:hypothetical protein
MKQPAGIAAVLVGVALLAPAAGRTALNVSTGLTTQSFSNQNRTGTRSVGYLTVLRAGRYRFEVRSPVSSTFQIDGRGEPDVELGAGPHLVVIELTHEGPAPSSEFLWATGDGPPAPVPRWRLTGTREPPWKVIVVRSLDLVARTALPIGAALGIWVVYRRWRAPLTAAVRRYPRAALMVLFVGLAIVHTWPLASGLTELSRHDNSDAMLNEWALNWVAHQIVRDPLHLFDANIFHPERHTLAYSEAMLVQGVMGAPLFWIGAPPLLVYNVLVIAGFALTGFATALVAARWTGDWSAGILAGGVAAFNAHTLTRLPHLQALHVEFLPLALAALDVVLRDGRVKSALALAGWFVLQSLASFYLMVFSAFALAAAALVRPREWLGSRFRQVAPVLGVAAAVSLVALSPYLLPYWQVSRDQHAVRPLADVELYAASWSDYLASPSRLHFELWSRRFF